MPRYRAVIRTSMGEFRLLDVAEVGAIPGEALSSGAALGILAACTGDPAWASGFWVFSIELLGELTRTRDEGALRARIAELAARIEAGRLRMVRVPKPHLSGAMARLGEEPAPEPPKPEKEAKTWFEVKIVDEEGRPVGGLDVVLTHGSHNEKRKTSGAGVVRWTDVKASSSFGSVRLASLDDVREALADHVCEAGSEKAPPGKRLVVGEDALTASIEAETPETLVLVRPLVRVRLIGMHFDTNKCFLLDSAMRGIRQIVEVYRSDPVGTLLILGHTDAEADDAYNLDLSVERAEAVKAYLADDAAAWEAWFESDKPLEKRWGSREVNAMIGALPCESTVKGFQQWSNAARGTDLKVDGDPGPATRKALIQAYMALDGTTLPQGIDVAIHGCGEFFPRDDQGDEAEDPEDRRVEAYCFHHDVAPPVPGLKANKGEAEYAEWVKQVTREVDVEIGAVELRVRLHDQSIKPMTKVPYRLLFGGKIRSDGTSEDGWVVVFLPDNACPASVRVEWGEPDEEGNHPFHMDVVVACNEGAERAQATARLHNLGYLIGSDTLYDRAVRAFQRDYETDEVGLEGGGLPPKTRDKLQSIFETDCDATRSPKSTAPAEGPEEPEEPVYDSDGTASCFF